MESFEGDPLLGGEHPGPTTPPHLQARHIIARIILVIIVIMFGSSLTGAPHLRIYEDIICHHYYDDIGGTGKIDEALCKGDEVQEELAMVMGGMEIAISIPGLLFAFPYGILADRIGRKCILSLAMTGIILSQFWIIVVCWFRCDFPLRLIWISPIFQVIGGGGFVAYNMVYAIISDVSAEADRANRFFLAECSSMVAEMVAHSIASALMTLDPWIPIFVGITVLVIGSVCIIFVPETLHPRQAMIFVEVVNDDSEASPLSSPDLEHPNTFFAALRCTSIRTSIPLILLLATFVPPAPTSNTLVLQYITKRFSWSIARVNFLLSLLTGINIILFIAVLPFLSRILPSSVEPAIVPIRKINLPAPSKDLLLGRISLMLNVLGALLLAFSALSFTTSDSYEETAFPITLAMGGLIIYTLGMGFSTFCRSLITTLVAEEHIALLHSAISVAEAIGSIFTAPALAWLYAWGMTLARNGMGNGYLGLPFYGVVLFSLSAGSGIIWFPVVAKEEFSDS